MRLPSFLPSFLPERSKQYFYRGDCNAASLASSRTKQGLPRGMHGRMDGPRVRPILISCCSGSGGSNEFSVVFQSIPSFCRIRNAHARVVLRARGPCSSWPPPRRRPRTRVSKSALRRLLKVHYGAGRSSPSPSPSPSPSDRQTPLDRPTPARPLARQHNKAAQTTSSELITSPSDLDRR